MKTIFENAADIMYTLSPPIHDNTSYVVICMNNGAIFCCMCIEIFEFSVLMCIYWA